MKSVSLAVALFASVSHAEDTRLIRGTTLLGGSWYQAGFAYGGGGLIHRPGVPAVPLTGLHFHERHGVVSFGLTSLLAIIGTALSAWDIKQQVEVYEVKGYLNGREQVLERTTTTTTTYTQTKSDEQVAQEIRHLQDGLSGGTWLDLTVYADDLFGIKRGAPGGSGFDAALGLDAVLGHLGSNPVVLDLGFQVASVSAAAPPGLEAKQLTYASVGFLGRLYVPVTRFLTLTAEFILNFFSLEYLLEGFEEVERTGRNVSSPLKLGVQTSLTDYVYLRAQGTLGGFGFTEGKLGFQLETGVRL
jgi:hypothetical protein